MGEKSSVLRTPWEIQKAVIFALFLRELKSRFGGFKGGFVWMLVEPLAHITIMSMIFSFIRDRQIPGIDFPVYMVCGIVPFLLFKNIAVRVMEGISSNRGLFSFRQVKPMDAFLARTLLDTLLSITVFTILLVGMAWIGLDVPFREPLTVMFIYAIMVLAGLGLGMIFCVVVYYMPESRAFIRMIFLPLYLLSGVIYPVSRMPVEFLDWLLWNPLLHGVETLRGAFFANYHVAQGVNSGYFFMATLIVLFLGISWFFAKRHDLLAR